MIDRGAARGASYTLITPANHYSSRLPNFPGASIVKLVTPRLAPARFGEYIVELAAGGRTSEPVAGGFEHFLYGLEGAVVFEGGGAEFDLSPGRWTYLPADLPFGLRGDPDAPTRLLWLKRRYEPFGVLTVPSVTGGPDDEDPPQPVPFGDYSRLDFLNPDTPNYDFNMSLLSFEPGGDLGRIEIHDEEHGLYMTAGDGTYVLDGDTHHVQAGDFVYMAPYCPQGFTAGDDGAEYLLYTDVYRDGFRQRGARARA